MPDVTIVTLCRNGRNYFCTIKPMKGDTTMSYNDWKDKTVSFKKIDVRGVQGNFFPGLKMQAAKMAGKSSKVLSRFRFMRCLKTLVSSIILKRWPRPNTTLTSTAPR